jgi:hypothetical protein
VAERQAADQAHFSGAINDRLQKIAIINQGIKEKPWRKPLQSMPANVKFLGG